MMRGKSAEDESDEAEQLLPSRVDSAAASPGGRGPRISHPTRTGSPARRGAVFIAPSSMSDQSDGRTPGEVVVPRVTDDQLRGDGRTPHPWSGASAELETR